MLLDRIERVLRGKVIIVGVGNLLRSDDAFGCLLAAKLKNRIALAVEEVADVPENFLNKIVAGEPDTIVFVDAVDFGGRAGELQLLDSEGLNSENLFFTHNPSPQLWLSFLKENTQARIYFLAVQPKDINLGERLSPEVEKQLEELSSWFLEKYGKEDS